MSGKARVAKLRRIQDLFVEGKAITLPAADGSAIRLWVTKPSAFERDEAAADGRAARARKVIAFDHDEDQQAMVDAKLADGPRSEIIESLVNAKGNEFYVKASDEVRANKDWQEKLVALDRSYALVDDLARGAGEGDENVRSRLTEEREVLRQLNLEYLTTTDEITRRLQQEYAAELEQADDERLAAEYRKAYRKMAGTQAFLAERRITELYFAVRDCEATEDGDHSKCNSHLTRLAEHRHEVYTFPDALLIAAREALDDLNMQPQDAAFSDAPTSSSASSEQPSEPAESTASTPDETPAVPAGT